MSQTKAILIQGDAARLLRPVPLTRAGDTLGEGKYSEAWLQRLIQTHPDILPIAEIEPGFGRLVPVSIEAPCAHGLIDNLFVTPDGGIAIVETKLWRNPQARRAVVTQVLDYAAAISGMDYAGFERVALAGEFPSGTPRPSSLYALVESNPDAIGESAFIDAIASNLKRGRMLVIAAGDGMHSETEALAELLQSHAGARFTFALVAIDIFSAGPDTVFAVPRQLAKTTMIERGVVRIVDTSIVVEAEKVSPKTSAPKQRTTITQEMFMEAMAKRDPALPDALRQFFDRVAPLGVQPDWKASLIFRWHGWPGGPVNLGYIMTGGALWTDATNWKVGAELARNYNEELAAAFGGRTRDKGAGAFLVGPDGVAPMHIEKILPAKAEAWAVAMERFIARLKEQAIKEEIA